MRFSNFDRHAYPHFDTSASDTAHCRKHQHHRNHHPFDRTHCLPAIYIALLSRHTSKRPVHIPLVPQHGHTHVGWIGKRALLYWTVCSPQTTCTIDNEKLRIEGAAALVEDVALIKGWAKGDETLKSGAR
jgi:hypothetical protein